MRGLRNCATAIVAAGLLLSGCGGSDNEKTQGQIGFVKGFFGGVAADEPHATLVGRDVLTAGGTAADAAVSMIFTMAVTAPANVSLAGGGVCVVHDAQVGVTEALDFVGPPGSGPAGDRPTAVPALPRGMAALHARYGNLDWRQLVSPAERLARLGHRMSRASAKDLKLAAAPLFADADARDIFAGEDGQPFGEGDKFSQLDLGAMLGKVRASGAGAMYDGVVGRQLVQAVREAGGTLTLEDLRGYFPEWRDTLRLPLGEDELHVSRGPAGGGALAQALAMLRQDERYQDAVPDERPHLVLEALKRAYGQRPNYLAKGWMLNTPPQDLIARDKIERLMQDYDPQRAIPVKAPKVGETPAGAGLVVVDRRGRAVACELGLNNLFGTGRVAPGTGMVLAAAPTGKTRNPLNLAPVIVANPSTNNFRFAAAGGGGMVRTSALVRMIQSVFADELSLEQAQGQARFTPGPALKKAYLELRADAGLADGLKTRGHVVSRTEDFARVNMLYCPYGLPDHKGRGILCEASADPRWHGLSVLAQD